MSVGERQGSAAPRPRGTSNQARWDEVLAAAAEVFSEKGYRAATLQDIASRVGMLKGSLYYYIDNKEDLLVEILRRAHLQGIGFVQEDEETAAADPPARLAALIQRWMDGVESLPPELRVAEYDFRYLEGAGRAEVLDLREQIAAVPTRIIEAGIADGYFAAVDPYIAVSTLFRVMSTASQWYRPGRVEWPAITEWYIRLFLGGLVHGGPVPATLPKNPVPGP